MEERLVTISMRFPVLDAPALADHLIPVITAAISAGGITTHVNIQPYEEEPDAG